MSADALHTSSQSPGLSLALASAPLIAPQSTSKLLKTKRNRSNDVCTRFPLMDDEDVAVPEPIPALTDGVLVNSTSSAGWCCVLHFISPHHTLFSLSFCLSLTHSHTFCSLEFCGLFLRGSSCCSCRYACAHGECACEFDFICRLVAQDETESLKRGLHALPSYGRR